MKQVKNLEVYFLLMLIPYIKLLVSDKNFSPEGLNSICFSQKFQFYRESTTEFIFFFKSPL